MNVDRLGTLVTDDIVAMTEMVSARALKRDFRQAFEQVDIERVVPRSELVMHGRWAIGIDEVESTRSLEEAMARLIRTLDPYSCGSGNRITLGRSPE